MKNLKLYLAIFAMLRIATLSAQDEPINVWIPWTCQDGSQVGPVPNGHRSAAIQFDAPWGQGSRVAIYSINGGNPVFWQNITPGRHVFEVTDPNPNLTVNTSAFTVALGFIDDVGSIAVTTPITISTEPAPNLTISSLQVGNTGEISWDISSETESGNGFGILTTCSDFEIVILVTGENTLGETIFEQELSCAAGQPTAQSMSWQYQGPSTEIRLTAKMQRVDTEAEAVFGPFTIVETQSEWIDVGDFSITTSVANVSSKSSDACFPNPFEDHLFIKTRTGQGGWKISDATGRMVLMGSGDNNINTGEFAPGQYILTFDDGTAMRMIKG